MQVSYQAVSAVSVAGEDMLRGSGQNYPDWVRERYLVLPESVPSRVLGLGRDLTGTAPTPYDRALAIERYLRTIPYSLDVPVPPPDRDVSDFFLFDLRRGYCDYYATAMVVLARAAGVPARLVTGFASGEYDPERSSFVVTAADAHTWVEVFFPGYGWIEFEPTAGRSPITRSGENFPEVPAPEEQEPEPLLPPPAAPAWKTLFLTLTGLLFTLLAGFVLWQIYDEWTLKRLPPSGAVTAIYHRLFQESQQMDRRINLADTPYELSRKMGEKLSGLKKTSRFRQQISPADREVEALADVFAKSAYSPRLPSQVEREQAVLAWRKLHWRLWLARLVSMRGGKEYN
jgi:hypothetical protein